MLKDYMGILTLNENDDRIKNLTRKRPLASVPIGGRYRIIDFVLSNMVNAGIKNIGILTNSKSRSLMDHLGSGKPWDLDRKITGLFLFNYGTSREYWDDVELLKNNMEYLYQSKENYVIISPSYMVCNIDYRAAAAYHEASGKDITIIYKKVTDGTKDFIECDLLNLDNNNSVTSVGKNIGLDSSANISMEMFIMKKEVLIGLILKCIKTGLCRTIKEAVYRNVDSLNVTAYEFNGYLSCINSTISYYRTNMDMLEIPINRELFFNNGPILTKVKDESPSKYGDNSRVSNSLIANGCIIDGVVENSIIFRRVKIAKGAHIKNCIIMQNSDIGKDAKLENIITDKNTIIEENRELKGSEKIPLVIEKKTLF